MKSKKIIEFTPNGYTMGKEDRELLAGSIMDFENVEVICKEFCSEDREVTIVLKNVFIAVDWKIPSKL